MDFRNIKAWVKHDHAHYKYEQVKLIKALLCGLSKPVMSTQNAVSWGMIRTDQKTWEKEM
jgi:hypothetical protein